MEQLLSCMRQVVFGEALSLRGISSRYGLQNGGMLVGDDLRTKELGCLNSRHAEVRLSHQHGVHPLDP